MKLLLQFLLSGILYPCSLLAQNLEPKMIYPDTLRSANDSVYINSPKWDKIKRLKITKEDTIDWGTYGHKGVHFEIWTDLDTLHIPHVNHPYEQHIKIPLISSKDTTHCILRFQAINSNFDNSYVEKNKGNVSFEIPEVYELANIILYLSECSEKTNNHPEDTPYVKRLENHFAGFKYHKLVQILNKKCSNSDFWNTYYGFRENSLAFKFVGEYLSYDTPYKHVFWDSARLKGGQFRNMLYLIQDFAEKSNFRSFYNNNIQYYEKLKQRQSKLLPINQMWDWIEQEFPQRMDSYKIVFSPLIGGSHSTQKFISGFLFDPEFQESVMFINSPESIDANPEYSEELKEGIMSGIVFTEIDHNYVNPTSDQHIEQIKSILHNRDFWATKDAQRNYSSEYAIFNEYMTHSVFCVYVLEKYPKELANIIIDDRMKLMERRGYPKFKEFNEKVMTLMKDNPKSIFESYDEVLKTMTSIK
ncbi:DUF4932 domain-containing protein [Maribacter sp. 2308TA10-17]|uniref:DUF4932 domain-containing protein n=1 Tax=Maribacter sp. 2308TA10-17 TaxID=3386276 RepID=UPI0039BC25E4